MNRAQRRAAKRSAPKKPAYTRLTPEERAAALIKNGITPRDMDREYERGYHEGFETAITPGYKTMFAAVCIVLHEKYGFGPKRCCSALQAVYDYITQTLTSADATQEVFDKMGLALDFDSPGDKITIGG